MVLPETRSPAQRVACFGIPVVHDAFLSYLFAARLESRDLGILRRDVLLKGLLDVATETIGPVYVGIEAVDFNSPPLDPASRTLSAQCR
jgi:hypothetical protein